MKIRLAIPADLPFIVETERECLTAAHWSEEQYRRLFDTSWFDPQPTGPQRLVLLAEDDRGSDRGVSNPTLLGFLVAHHVASEWELENIAVAPTARRTGVGKRLLDELIMRARQVNSQSVFLEVRESNLAARKLYERLEFQETGRRKSYYSNPLEDAIGYRRTLGPGKSAP